MLKIIFSVIMLVHGMVHFMGFLKAFNFIRLEEISGEISKPLWIIWLLAGLLFVLGGILFLLKKDWWWIIGLIGVLLSQLVIFFSWSDAKWGSIPNIIALLVVVASIWIYFFWEGYKKDVVYNFENNNSSNIDLLSEKDLEQLPNPVKKYLDYVGVIGKPKVKNMYVAFEWEMRWKWQDFFPFLSEQYNFFNDPTRLFFMKGTLFWITVPWYHKYMWWEASMNIKLFGFIPVVSNSGDVMRKAETVTIFNDMCLMAPASLIDKRITWELIDDSSVKAKFTNKDISITAILYFNNKWQLINFVSDDRMEVTDMKQYTFSTPIWEYKNINGYNLPSYGEAVWDYPDWQFVYWKFNFKDIQYNLSEYKGN